MKPRIENGYWRVRLTMPDGTRKSFGLGHSDRVSPTEAGRQAKAIMRDVLLGRVATGTDTPLSKWRDSYLASKGEWSHLTREDVEKSLDKLIDHFGKDRRIGSITSTEAEAFAAELLASGLAKNTVRKHCRNIKAMFQAAVDAEPQVIASSPFRRVASSVVSTPKDWATVTEADLQAILDACPNPGYKALFALCRLAGLRRSEAVALRWEHVTPERIAVYPRSDTEGTKQRYREVPVQPKLAAILANISRSGYGPCDGVEEDKAAFYRVLTGILSAAKVQQYAKPLHTLRKNLETEWLSKYPMSKVAHWLGHSPTVAMKHYDRPEEKDFDMVAKGKP